MIIKSKMRALVVNRWFILGTFIVLCTLAFILKSLIVYDISITDESSMYSCALRFYQGDAVLAADWDPWQLYGVVLLPFIAIFRIFFSSNQGFFLFMRINFLLIRLLILLYVIWKSKYVDLNRKGIIIAALLNYCFVSWNFEAFTYQQLPLMFGMFILIATLSNKQSRLEIILVGVAYSVIILSTPFLVLSYPLVLILLMWKNKREKKKFRFIIYFHLGILIIFIPFCVLVLSKTSISGVVQSLSYIFTEQGHNYSSIGVLSLLNNNIVRVFVGFIRENRFTSYLNITLLLVIFIFSILKCKYKRLIGIFIPIVMLLSIFSMIPEHKMFFMNELYISFVWVSIELLFYIKEKEYLICIVFGYILVFAIALCTNTGKYTTSGALSIIAVICLMFLVDYAAKNDDTKRHLFKLTTIALFLRVYITWWGIPLSSDFFEHKILVGPMKGMYARDEEYEHYMTIYNDINSVEYSNDDVLFCGTSTPIAYLIADKKIGTMNLHFFYLDYERLRQYWDLYPEKTPTVIYYEKYTSIDGDSFLDEMINELFEIKTEGHRLIAIKKKTE